MFIINLIPLHVLVLIIIGRFSYKIYIGMNVFSNYASVVLRLNRAAECKKRKIERLYFILQPIRYSTSSDKFAPCRYRLSAFRFACCVFSDSSNILLFPASSNE